MSGWSGTADYGLSRRAADLRTVISGVTAPVALIGASMGGSTGLQAIAEGLRPQALVLVDIALRPSRAGIQRIFDFMSANPDGFATLDEAGKAITAYNPARKPPKTLDGLRKTLRQDENGRYRWHWDPRILEAAGRGMEGLEQTLQALPFRMELNAMLVRGIKSDVVTDESVDHLRELLPRLTVANVAEAGHMVAGDRNDAFNQVVVEYLTRIMPATTSSLTPPVA